MKEADDTKILWEEYLGYINSASLYLQCLAHILGVPTKIKTFWLVNWGLTSHQHLRSYGDGTSVYSPIRRAEEEDFLDIGRKVMSPVLFSFMNIN